MSKSVRLDHDLAGFDATLAVLEDLPAGRLAHDLAQDAAGGEPLPLLPDGRWAVGATADGLRLFAAGDDGTWTIYRHASVDESDATAAASLLHAKIGSAHSEWDADR